MIKDIGIEGLKVTTAAPKNDIYLSQWQVDEMDNPHVVDVTTFDDTERVYMQYFPEITGPR